MECSFCRHHNTAGARSCARCGAPLGTAADASRRTRGEPPGQGERPAGGADGRTVARAALRASASVPVRGPAVVPDPVRRPAPATATVAPDLASLGQRLGGALLDGLLLSAIALAAQFATGFVVPRPTTPQALAAYVAAMATVVGSVSALALVYFTIGNARGQTLGKRLVGTRVVHYRTRERLGWGRGLARAGMLFVLGLPAGLGYFSVLGPERRGWHDLVSSAVVVTVPPRPRVT